MRPGDMQPHGRSLIGIVLFVLLAQVGCQKSAYPLVHVSGVVTFDGGRCPHTGCVTLQPLEIAEGLPKRPATGTFNINGAYVANTFSDDQGVLPGRYRVEVTCFAGAPDFSKPDPWNAVNYIAAEYEPGEIVIEKGSQPVRYDIDVPRNKNMKM